MMSIKKIIVCLIIDLLQVSNGYVYTLMQRCSCHHMRISSLEINAPQLSIKYFREALYVMKTIIVISLRLIPTASIFIVIPSSRQQSLLVVPNGFPGIVVVAEQHRMSRTTAQMKHAMHGHTPHNCDSVTGHGILDHWMHAWFMAPNNAQGCLPWSNDYLVQQCTTTSTSLGVYCRRKQLIGHFGEH